MRNYRNYLPLRGNPDPTERRENLVKEVLRNTKVLPEPITYEDYDQAMMDWSNTALDLSFEGKQLKTIALYTNQRFEEYMQDWEHSDDKKNILMNFKTIIRENNPKQGSINGNDKNIPGDRFYTVKREQVVDKNGQISYMDWKMKQPFAVDLTYVITLVTGKFELINKFNTLVQDIFKSGYSYIHVKGHYVSISMEDPSDESEYAIDDRRYFQQKIQLKVKAYIIQKEDLMVEEIPTIRFHVKEMDDNGTSLTAENDDDSVIEDNGLYYKPLTLTAEYEKCEINELKTRIPYNMVVKNVILNNVKSFKVYSDGEEVSVDGDFMFEEAAMTKLIVKRSNPFKECSIIFEGYDRDVIYDENLIEEDEFVDTQTSEDLYIS